MKKVIVSVVALAVIGLLAYYLYNRYGQKNLEPDISGKPKYDSTIVNYSASWCGNSLEFMPVWERFREELRRSRPDIRTVTMMCDKDGNQEKCDRRGVNGYPTVIMYKNGKEIQFDGARTIMNLHEFVRLNTEPVKY